MKILIVFFLMVSTANATQGDVSGDGLVGLEEAVYALQVASGAEPQPGFEIVHCDSNPYGGVVNDVCGVCGGDGSTCLGCDGVPYSGLIDDPCGVCGGDGSSCAYDCNNVKDGTAYIDQCGACVEGNTGLTACTQDCYGDLGGDATVDSCGICVGGNTGVSTLVTCVSAAGQIWMDRNLGASRVATSITDSEAYGDLYQWGRGSDGHEKRMNTTTTPVLSSTDSPGHSSFIKVGDYPYDWRIPQSANLWQGTSGINNPCPTGFRLPTRQEMTAVSTNWYLPSYAFASPLKLVLAGDRYRSDGVIYHEGTRGYYATSTVVPSDLYYGDQSYKLYLEGDNVGISLSTHAMGYSVRCIKD